MAFYMAAHELSAELNVKITLTKHHSSEPVTVKQGQTRNYKYLLQQHYNRKVLVYICAKITV